MFRIERSPWGFSLTFSGVITSDEMAAWRVESLAALQDTTLTRPFRVYVDMQGLQRLPPTAREILISTQAAYRSEGMDRSVVVYAKRATAEEQRATALASGIEAGERYISVEESNWNQEAMNWMLYGIEPSHH